MAKHAKETLALSDDKVAIHLTLVFDRTVPEPSTNVYAFSDAEIIVENFNDAYDEMMASNLLTVFGISDKNGTQVQQKIREKMLEADYFVL